MSIKCPTQSIKSEKKKEKKQESIKSGKKRKTKLFLKLK